MSANLHEWVDGCSAETGSEDLCRTEGGSYSHASPSDFRCAFGESFAFISLLFPRTTVLIAAGTLLSDGTLPYASTLVGAVVCAVLGDSVSYWLGRSFGGGIGRLWPFSRHPDVLPRGILFFARHGDKAVLVARFILGLRTWGSMLAGMARMPFWRFQLFRVTSWAATSRSSRRSYAI